MDNNPYRTALIFILSSIVVMQLSWLTFAPPLSVCFAVRDVGTVCADWHGGSAEEFTIPVGKVAG